MRVWENQLCPEMHHGSHEPRAVALLPYASSGQPEAELHVRCRLCGRSGLMTVGLHGALSSIVDWEPKPAPKPSDVHP